MLHFSKKTEYALIAMGHMTRKGSDSELITSTREVAEAFHIPYPLLGKVLQKLAAKGLIKSVQGTKGGYVLARHPHDISLAAVIEIFEGPWALTDCMREERITCPQWSGCSLKHPLAEINHKIYDVLLQTTVADLQASSPGVHSNSAAELVGV